MLECGGMGGGARLFCLTASQYSERPNIGIGAARGQHDHSDTDDEGEMTKVERTGSTDNLETHQK